MLQKIGCDIEVIHYKLNFIGVVDAGTANIFYGYSKPIRFLANSSPFVTARSNTRKIKSLSPHHVLWCSQYKADCSELISYTLLIN